MAQGGILPKYRRDSRDLKRSQFDQYRYTPRRRRRNIRRYLLIVLEVLAAWIILDLLTFLYSHTGHSPPPPPSKPYVGRVFIASNHWNSAPALPRWSDGLVGLIKELGIGNAFVSIYESGSWDATKSHLQALETRLNELGVKNTVVVSDRTHKDEMSVPKSERGEGWIHTSRVAEGEKELRRIPYLAGLRNKALEPMEALRKEGVVFDRVLFLNDVVFEPQDAIRLLQTRDGQYAAACALDFSKPPLFYDTFAVRDWDGLPAFSQRYPYFTSRTSWKALYALEPVPVRSCWNGMVALPAHLFLSNGTSTPLSFRGLPDSLALRHLEASECCLIHEDNPLTTSLGVWLNPLVRVGYNVAAYEGTHGSRWPYWSEALHGWANNWVHSVIDPFWITKTKMIKSRIKKWKEEQGEKGIVVKDETSLCVIDEMQVLIENGWAHVW